MKKKNKKALGWWQKLNAGDPEKNMEIFNKNMTYNKTSETSSESSEAAMAEAIESIIENPQTNLEALKALELKEKFKNKALLNKKYGKHVKGTEGEKYIYYPGYSEEEYEKEAEKLQRAKVDNDFIVGYRAGKDYVKYNTDTDDMVAYSYWNKDGYNSDGEYHKAGEDYTITYYKAKNPDNYRDHLQKDLSRTGEDFTELSIGEALKELN